jgi:geranylgeranyl pyrophosphate synthase
MKEDKSVQDEAGEELFEKFEEFCEKEGAEGWKRAQTTLLKDRARAPGLQEAMEYAMLKYKPDYFRPTLLSLCSKTVGGNPRNTVSTSAALTLFAWAIGIHDDIIDQTITRHKRRTIFGKFGKDLSLILSDVLLFKGFTLLRETLESEVPTERVIETLETFEKIWFEQSDGEAIEILSRRQTDITPKECLEKIRMRASEMEVCTRIGGILGGGSAKQIEDLGSYGRLIGMMGCLRNELIDMLEFNVLRSRIKRESLPLPVVYALQNPKVRPKLISLLTKSRLSKQDLRNISKLSDRFGGIDYVAKLIEEMAEKTNNYAKRLRNKELKMFATTFLIRPEEWKPLLAD